MSGIDVYMEGVGGQGIGLLSEILIRAADHAGLFIKAVDTHGLAQRGGVVVSQLRIGEKKYSPLIMEKGADIVIALERHEALRAMNGFLKDGGTLIYYNAVWQPLDVRLNNAVEIGESDITNACVERGIKEIRVHKPGLKDPRMQNIVLLAHIDRHGLIKGVKTEHMLSAMDDLMEGEMLKKNIALFQEERNNGN